jgi:hypothetical protein
MLDDLQRGLNSDGSRKVTYASMGNDPVIAEGGPKPGDVHQGAVGDCWLMSSLAALANTHPELIEAAVAQRSGDQVTVPLHSAATLDYSGKPTPDRVTPTTVDLDFPVYAGESGPPEKNMVYAGVGESHALWPAVLEKAFAADPNTPAAPFTDGAPGYGNLKGNKQRVAFHELLGDRVKTQTLGLGGWDGPRGDPTKINEETAWSALNEASTVHDPVTASVMTGDTPHGVAVLGEVTTPDGKRMVRVENQAGGALDISPAGVVDEGGGVFLIPLDTFYDEFLETDVHHILPPKNAEAS